MHVHLIILLLNINEDPPSRARINNGFYKLPKSKRKELGIKELPTTLKAALDELQNDDVLQKTLGSHIFDAFIDLKTNDWNQYCLYVSPWEIMKYLDY
jgi:glutamine synthetase